MLEQATVVLRATYAVDQRIQSFGAHRDTVSMKTLLSRMPGRRQDRLRPRDSQLRGSNDELSLNLRRAASRFACIRCQRPGTRCHRGPVAMMTH
jgi:hypothetical protein